MNELAKRRILKTFEKQMVEDGMPPHEIKSILEDTSNFLDYKINKLRSRQQNKPERSGDV